MTVYQFLDKNLLNFNEKKYFSMIDKYGLKKTWDSLMRFLKTDGIDNFNKYIVDFYEIGKLYEMGLAYINKDKKKNMGQYYTPLDVSKFMAQLLTENEKIECLADVACGCGNLVIEVLKIIRANNNYFNKIINNLYLYDLDLVAINICIARIESLFNLDLSEKTNKIVGDFLSKKISLPKNVSVISNPPYSVIKKYDISWNKDEAFEQAKELYIGFFSKIIDKCDDAVIVSPQSFIVGKKFVKFRDKLSKKHYGEIYAFDNVPATLFDGKKEGIFNTNTSNGVRAAITHIKKGDKGFNITPLIRFKSYQRSNIIEYSFLKNKLGNEKQNLKKPVKANKNLENFTYSILKNANKVISDLVEKDANKYNEEYSLCVSTSSRYYVVASHTKMRRNGFFTLYARDRMSFNLLYAILNSSYCYMWWRFWDGGILFSKSLLLDIPLTDDIFKNCNENVQIIINDMIINEEKFYCYKKNANKIQQSIKFPEYYRNKINNLLFGKVEFNSLHQNYEKV